ncbi:hypothetical protein [Cohnella luojiensis]|uniref:Uncharacterized protein n=1 Tax=Cohnella luojiensis TaxID=652876 RepID=A0A4Y8LZ95_9BACL|nr:hypothetical protein [Cohnella luojiensis]TFE26986.1 hypothetical protein E2980_10870 [Cohnella luojiensis]
MNVLKDLSLIRLAHYVPFESLDLAATTKNDLVLNALFIENTALTATEIKEKISMILGCNLDLQTIQNSLNSLTDDNLVTQSKDKYVLSFNCYSLMKSKVTEVGAFQEEVIEDWINESIKPHFVELDSVEISSLKDQLIQFLSILFLHHGAASKALIENELLTDDNLSTNDIIESLPFRSQSLKIIAKKEYLLFLGSTNANIRRYLEQLIEKAFRYLTTICDPNILEGIKHSIQGKDLYLDSSTVYRLLNLQGEHRYLLVRDVVNLCREFGFNLKVSVMTLKELERRISFDSRVLLEFPTPVALSAVGYKYMTEENFVSTYWRTAKRQGIEISDFISKYRNIDIVLEEEGIEVERVIPAHSNEFNVEWTDLISKINNRSDHEKSAAAAEHDAYLISLMVELRKNQVINRFLDSPAWVLTTDRFFIRFQNSEIRFREELPFALLPTQLIQILRFVRPTDNKFNEMFLDVFSRTFVPISDGLSNMHTQKILSRISQYKGATPFLAEKVLSDQYFRNRFKNSESEEEKEEIIHESLVEKASELEELVEEKDNKLQQLESRIDEFNQKQERLLEIIGEKTNVITSVSQELEDSKRESGAAVGNIITLQEQLSSSNMTIEGLKEQVELLIARQTEKDSRRTNQITNFKKITTVVFFILGVALLFIFLFPIFEKIGKSTILTLVTISVWPLSYYLFKNKKYATLVASIISIVATIFALYYTILQ